MDIHVITIFPEFFESFLKVGLLGKAVTDGLARVSCVQLRDFTADRRGTIDDAPFGGGSGMVMMPGPVVDALESLPVTADGVRPHRVLVTPQGVPFNQATARRFAALPSIAFVCGRYEGFDERIRHNVDEEVSLGDFVLLGGETAAATMIEASVRLIPGVLGNEESPTEESHEAGLLEYPQYTRPREFRGEAVPEMLLSGNHEAIRKWRRKEALRRTRARRPDMFAKVELTAEDKKLLKELDREAADAETSTKEGT